MSSQPTPTPLPASAPPRLLSLDALRGFDMFWILGMEEFAAALTKANPSPWAQFIGRQLDHAEWEGFRFLDLVFPLFVFISGVSLVFSISASIARQGRAATVRKLFVRFLLLYALGLIYYGGISHGIDGVRWVGVLQRIAICGMAAGLLVCFTGLRTRIAACVALLLGYWALLSFVPIPGDGGGGAGDFAEGPSHNWVNWIDFHFLPGKRWDKTHDPEGLLSTLPAIATCLLGVFTGDFLQNSNTAPSRKARTLIVAGIILSAIGWTWSVQFPVIKKLWTSSYVLVGGGYSSILLGAFYWLIDVRYRKAWSVPFIWIGANAITLYMARHLLKLDFLADAVLGGPVARTAGAYAGVVAAIGILVLNVLLARFLYQRKIFVRV